MAKQGRHRRKGPGGPSRPRRAGRPAPGTERVRLRGPSVAGMVDALLATVRQAAPEGTPARALAVELWAQHVTAYLYDLDSLPPELYAELGAALAVSGDPEAPAVLAALALVLDAEPLRAARAEGDDLGIGRAVATRALAVDDVQGDGTSLVVDLDQPGCPHSVTVHVDHNLLGLARDLALGPPFDRLGLPDDVVVTEISLADARARIEDALATTAHSPGAPTSDDYDQMLPVVARRVAALPAGGRLPPRPTVSEDELAAIVERFLASPEVAALPEAARDHAGWVAELWIDFAVHGTIGGPYRVSEVLVELFCTGGFQETDPDAATVAAAPAVLDAWLRHAAAVTGLGDPGRDEALAALARCAPLLAEAPDDDPVDADDLSSLPPVDPGRWAPLAPAGPAPWAADEAGVPAELLTRVRRTAAVAAHLAGALLGGPHVQAAVDVVLAAAVRDPSPLAGHVRADRWAAAAVWRVADEAGAFADRDPGDLAAALGADARTLAEAAARLG